MAATRYNLAPGLEVVRQADDRFQLRSDFTAIELSGETAAELVEKIFDPLQGQPLTFDEIAARLPDYRPESLRAQIDNFVRAGVLVAVRESAPAGNRTFDAFLDEIG